MTVITFKLFQKACDCKKISLANDARWLLNKNLGQLSDQDR